MVNHSDNHPENLNKLVQMSTRDALTGLPNRFFFESRLREEIRRARRDKNALALMILDLDFFKLLNDTLGQRWGDQVLKKVGKVLLAKTKPDEVLCRMEWDDFGLLLPGKDLKKAEGIARDLLRSVSKSHYPGEGLFEELFPEGKLTGSIGLTAFTPQVEREFDLIAWADYALYRAKRQGRNRVVIQQGPPHGGESNKQPLSLFQSLGAVFSQEMGFADKLNQTVKLIQEWLSVDVCSLYLLESKQLVLRATVGLNPNSIGKVKMTTHEGLTGLAVETLTSVCAREAAKHPRYKYFPETGEEQFGSYLGVPVLYGHHPLGVIVVQTRSIQDFSEQDIQVMETIAGFLGSLVRPIDTHI